LTGGWVPRGTRDAVVDFVRHWSDKANIALKSFIRWLTVEKSKFYSWVERYGKANEYNAPILRDFWLEQWEREAIIRFYIDNPFEGYRRLTFMMLDRDIVAVSPATTWRVLSRAGLLAKWNKKNSLKGTGFVQPLKPHEHWHVDISYLNIHGTYLLSLLPFGRMQPLGYVTPADKLNGRDQEILKERDRKLETARELRKQKLQEPFCNSNVSYLLNL
jgi:putative transposase